VVAEVEETLQMLVYLEDLVEAEDQLHLLQQALEELA
jgi:hypothetical protein